MWDRMADDLCADLDECFDVMPEMQIISSQDLDKGYDGSHYGPSTNKWIAELIQAKIDL